MAVAVAAAVGGGGVVTRVMMVAMVTGGTDQGQWWLRWLWSMVPIGVGDRRGGDPR